MNRGYRLTHSWTCLGLYVDEPRKKPTPVPMSRRTTTITMMMTMLEPRRRRENVAAALLRPACFHRTVCQGHWTVGTAVRRGGARACELEGI